MGHCKNCNVEKERSSLMVCGRCKYAQYCSKECQTANWKIHSNDCDIICLQKEGSSFFKEDLIAIHGIHGNFKREE